MSFLPAHQFSLRETSKFHQPTGTAGRQQRVSVCISSFEINLSGLSLLTDSKISVLK
jgi:hypothetical protein